MIATAAKPNLVNLLVVRDLVASGEDSGYGDSWSAYSIESEYIRMRVRDSPHWKIDSAVNREYQVSSQMKRHGSRTNHA